MYFQRTLLASAALSALAGLPSSVLAQTTSQTTSQTLSEVVVTASPFAGSEDAQLFAPAKVLTGDELRNKLGNSLGDTLSQELGVSASAFGAGASRPIVRGMEGPRVKILENGMTVSDVSSLSNDHAPATESATASQIEILRGPAALLYGSGAIGGVVNVVNNRIPTELSTQPSGEVEVRSGTADNLKNTSATLEGAVGKIGLHVDGNWRDTGDYAIPGNAKQSDGSSATGRLPNSFTHESSFGAGASLMDSWGHVGASVARLDDHYGIPTAEKSFIDLKQTRYDIDALLRAPLPGFDTFRFRLGYTDYAHTEKQQDGTPNTVFANRATETRWELTHQDWAGWRGNLGVQTDTSNFSALSASTGKADTVPQTRSQTFAAFVVEERQFGTLLISAGLRGEAVKRSPDGMSGKPDRDYQLGSWSLGSLWSFVPGYGLGLSYAASQRAPAAEELYSSGPHESTATYDIGDNSLKKETSHNIELSLQKTTGQWRWKTNLFQNQVGNYIYGRTAGKVDDSGNASADGEFTQRFWSQGDATIRGAEAEISYRLNQEGPSVRLFADTSHGSLDQQGSLPLQPATRYGLNLGYLQGAWRSGINLLHAQQQDRLAAFENYVTPSYTQLDANLAYTQRLDAVRVTWFAILRNLLNQDIRVSTSVLRETVPLSGRSLIVGVRTQF
ncbi:TonB-dependent receptor [Herbaspirillum sp. RTI4]|uniref:TonB-dependent receptor n=1 Tax=Herbaspirillum sp. RTI4 TaxID=3048640 RepID=UPI002AB3D48E|nr:TonB-dependent receptor [Herbaspirillum sp. RTI4]MDY7577380.1 TonB-dependent receptor [Herbaspirillum sp. RTI4]MEA9982392.1 TonB-dependent receptor [Herbaspirillum sp. RTI4]